MNQPARSILILCLALVIVFGSLLILAYGQGIAIRAATVPAGAIVIVKSGSCPTTFTEVTEFGSNSAPAFTGTQFDNRSAFRKVIFCSKD